MTGLIMLRYKKHHIDFLKQNYKLPTIELTKKFNKLFAVNQTELMIRQACIRRRLLSGINPQFKKGHVPHHKGTKGVIKASITAFKPGHNPYNKMPVGTERISSVNGYLMVKTENPSLWRYKHIVAWEQYHKRNVPSHHAVRFLDGDRLNIEPDNLILMSIKTNAYLARSDYKKLGIEMRHSAIKLAELIVKLREMEQ